MQDSKRTVIAVDEDLEQNLARALGPRAEVLEAYLFGSRATGRAQLHSDIDVAVYVDPSQTAGTAYGYPRADRAPHGDASHQ